MFCGCCGSHCMASVHEEIVKFALCAECTELVYDAWVPIADQFQITIQGDKEIFNLLRLLFVLGFFLKVPDHFHCDGERFTQRHLQGVFGND